MTADLTAILPLKNYCERFLRAALRSLFEQTSCEWRLIVVAEPADRQHFAALLQAELRDPRVTLVANQGRNLAGAINSGMAAARTAFTALLLGDDRWSADAVAVLQRNIAEHPGTDFFHSARRVIDEHDRFVSSVHPSRPSFAVDEFKWGSPIKHLLCWRRDAGLAVGGLDESLDSVGPDDWDFPWTMAEHGARFTAIQECLYYYRDHREGYRLTTHLPLSMHKRAIDRILRKHGVPRSKRRERIARSEQNYLQQCLYRSLLDRWLKQCTGFDARSGWREPYR